ncbi:hypothetical protein [Pedosphaera parvula]|uniref:Uncharacterized protein n=1 Tax=Pedosphaera parvula (strain Ellin514) TaxID=320771 RepID=B9XHT9_PEDPL|nr:hypothetical protein [Pedosphaera parvula]EEF60667.1 hypothetical protein Cflav_PD6258 [Pedosphaera parvula Ellin514]
MHLARTIARMIVFPMGLSYRRPVEIAWLVSAVLTLLFCAALSLPGVVDNVISERFLSSLHLVLRQHQPWLGRWEASLRLVFEVFTALFIGGSVFAKSAATSIEKRLEAYQTHLLTKSRTQRNDIERNAYRVMRKTHYLVTTSTLKNVWRRIPRLMQLSFESYSLFAQQTFWSYVRFVIVALLTSFPGGMYGFLAFVFLTLVCTVKLIQIYLTAMSKL